MNVTFPLDVLRDQIQRRFQDRVSQFVQYPTQFDNQLPFTIPDETPWMKAEIRTPVTDQTTIGSVVNARTIGLLIVEVNVRIGEGQSNARRIALFVASKFRAVRDGSIAWMMPSVNDTGQFDGWWRVTVTCPFQYDEAVTRAER